MCISSLFPSRLLLVLLLAGQVSGWAFAAEPRRGPAPHGAPAWHGDIHHFSQHDAQLWRGGRWVHGRHDGHAGWWWVIGTTWYFYPAPMYPYPNPYIPPPTEPMAPPAQHWYYCGEPAGYYPYVPQCPGGWTPVPAKGE